MNEDDARRLLGVAPGATSAEILKVWRRLTLQAHPDHLQGGSESQKRAAEERLRALLEAREVLLNRDKDTFSPDDADDVEWDEEAEDAEEDLEEDSMFDLEFEATLGSAFADAFADALGRVGTMGESPFIRVGRFRLELPGRFSEIMHAFEAMSTAPTQEAPEHLRSIATLLEDLADDMEDALTDAEELESGAWLTPETRRRVERAQRLVPRVTPVAGEVYDVPSESRSGRTYRVNVVEMTCTCEDRASGNLCKHLMAAMIAHRSRTST